MITSDIDKFFGDISNRLEALEDIVIYGTITRISGFMIEACGLKTPVGATCQITVNNTTLNVLAEVIGFSGDMTYLMAYTEPVGITPGSKIRFCKTMMKISVGDYLLGRMVDGLCEPIDDLPPFEKLRYYPLNTAPMNPIKRTRINKPIDVGVRAINALLTIGRGQRMGIFSGSGVGKSVLLGMITRFTEADVVVIGLIGERGREVKEFIEENVGAANMQKTIIIASPVDTSPLMRTNGALVATTIAEYFRDKGLNVLLILDSLTRYAQALRQMYLSLGEVPSSKGFSASVFSKISQLVERTGTGDVGQGSITAFYTVLTEDDDVHDPVADHARSILDGHIVLSRKLAENGHYPAIDISKSISRVMPAVISPQHANIVLRFKQLWSLYQDNQDLIKMGLYKAGSDKKLDEAIKYSEKMQQYLLQGIDEQADFAQNLQKLKEIFD
jgi:flagellum-specific ATP synthase